MSWLLILLTGIFSSFVSTNYDEIKHQTLKEAISQHIEEMTLEEKIGQMLMVSFHEHQLEDYVINKKIGGYILFNHNIKGYEELKKTTEKIRRLGETNQGLIPFISIDQEGGIVSRLDSLFYSFPGNMALGATDNLQLAEEQGILTGRMLRHLGINLNFAPVVDVNRDYRNPIIGLRSFGNGPLKVANMAGAFMKGQEKVGVISSLKHFPGHGNVHQDSHLQLPTNPNLKEDIRGQDMKPFEIIAREGADLIMTAHIKLPELDPNNPATLSSTILQGELRERLGYEGVIITDDLGSMKAITSIYSTSEAAIRAIDAGVDILLLVASSHKVEDTIEKIRLAVESGRLTEARIDQSVERILDLKYRYGLLGEVIESEENYEDLYQATVDHSKRVTDGAVTAIANDFQLVPFHEGKVMVVAKKRKNYNNPMTKKRESLENLVRGYYRNSDFYYIDEHLNVEDLKNSIHQYDRVIFLSEKGYQSQKSSVLLKYLQKSKKLILVSLAEPYEMIYLGDFHSHLAIYTSQREGIISTLQAIKGIIPIKGKNPVPVNAE